MGENQGHGVHLLINAAAPLAGHAVHTVAENIPDLSPHGGGRGVDPGVVVEARPADLTNLAALMLYKVGHLAKAVGLAVVAVSGRLEPSGVSRLAAQGRHDIALVAVLDFCANGPAVGLDELLTLNVEVDGRDSVPLGLILLVIHVVQLVDADDLGVLFADGISKGDRVTGGLSGDPVETLLDVLGEAGINGKCHIVYLHKVKWVVVRLTL